MLILPVLPLMSQIQVPRVEFPCSDVLAISSDGRVVLESEPIKGLGTKVDSKLVQEPARPLFLGYPHGPKTAEFVPEGRKTQTLTVQLPSPIDATVFASEDSFACSDSPDSVLGSKFGGASSGLDNSVYNRTADWLLSASGSGVRVTPLGGGRYRFQTSGAGVLTFKPRYYQDHQGYFLWDRRAPVQNGPASGWCSWAAYYQDVKEKDVLDAARFFAENLKSYGYSVIQIDDGYQRVLQDTDSQKLEEPFSHYWTKPNEKFPSGSAKVAAQISGLGMVPGIWVGYYLPLGLKNASGYTVDPDGKPHKGPWVNYAVNALILEAREEGYIDTVRTLYNDGWRYFKIDTLRHVLYDNYRQVPDYWKKRGESMETAYRTLLSETRKAIGDSYLLACWGTIPELAGLPDGCRIGEDVGPNFASMRRTAKYIAQFQYLNNVVWKNDPDYMCFRVPVSQAQAWATMNFLGGGHLMVSDPITAYDDAHVDVLRRVGPALQLKPNTVVSHAPDPEWMTLDAAKNGENWKVIAHFAWENTLAANVDLAKFGFSPTRKYLVFDFWKEKFLGVANGSLAVEALTQGDCQVLSLRPLEGRPQVLGTNRHLSQGAYELSDLMWAGDALSGKFVRTPGRAWSLYVYVPEGFAVASVEPDTMASSEHGNVLKLEFPEGGTPMEWKVKFRR